MKEIRILGIYISNRVKDASIIQGILTKYGCSIKTRLGLHDVDENHCSKSGIILLELAGNLDESIKLENELLKIEGLDVQKMIFLE